MINHDDGSGSVICSDGSSYELKNDHDNQTVKICPDGWRLPSKDDFQELLDIA